MAEPTDFDRRVRVEIYRVIVDEARAPSVDEVARALGTTAAEADASFRHLADAHAIVLERATSSNGRARIRMANPFSAVPTPFQVETPRGAYFGNCAWDSFGIPAALHASGILRTPCPDGCGDTIVAEIDDGERLRPLDAVVHFAVPARHWWDDIVFT